MGRITEQKNKGKLVFRVVFIKNAIKFAKTSLKRGLKVQSLKKTGL